MKSKRAAERRDEESDQDSYQRNPVLQLLHLLPPQDCFSDPEHGPDINGSPDVASTPRKGDLGKTPRSRDRAGPARNPRDKPERRYASPVSEKEPVARTPAATSAQPGSRSRRSASAWPPRARRSAPPRRLAPLRSAGAGRRPRPPRRPQRRRAAAGRRRRRRRAGRSRPRAAAEQVPRPPAAGSASSSRSSRRASSCSASTSVMSGTRRPSFRLVSAGSSSSSRAILLTNWQPRQGAGARHVTKKLWGLDHPRTRTGRFMRAVAKDVLTLLGDRLARRSACFEILRVVVD